MELIAGGRALAPIVLPWLFFMSATSADAAAEVWLDVDISIGIPEGEVDDGLALLQAFHSPELIVRGVSVVFGNATLKEAYRIARDVVGRFGPAAMQIHSGAASAKDFGKTNPAVDAMAAALAERPMTILALGPVTNVATLSRLHPELHGAIDAIVMVAARRPGQRFQTGPPGNRPHRDFNFELDPAAMAVLLDSQIKLVFAPWEVSSKVWITGEDLDDLGERGGSGKWVAEACRSWLGFWEKNLGAQGFNPFDTLAVGWVTHPELIESFEAGIWIEEARDDRVPPGGLARDKPYLLIDAERRDLKRVIYCHRPKPPFKAMLLDRLAQ